MAVLHCAELNVGFLTISALIEYNLCYQLVKTNKQTKKTIENQIVSLYQLSSTSKEVKTFYSSGYSSGIFIHRDLFASEHHASAVLVKGLLGY